MTDLLVRLYALPPVPAPPEGVEIRRAIAPEKARVLDWVTRDFGDAWASECDVAFAHVPVGVFFAVAQRELLGFACFDATARGFFGPTGVSEAERGRGIGTALLFATLLAMREVGYAYAVIGGVGPIAWYARTVGAIEIPDSTPGIYRGMLRK